MKAFLADCRYALRLYFRTPVSSFITVAVLAIGMAFVTAFISLYVDLVLKPHRGFEDAGRLVTYGWAEGVSAGRITTDLIERIAEESTTLEAAASSGRSTRAEASPWQGADARLEGPST